MLCPARCSCFLCRELQSCRAADSRKPTKMCDNFILKKSEAWDASSAMKFIRGAARMSVRHWQNKEPPPPPKARLATLKSTSCEQLFPYTNEEHSPFRMQRAPSTDRIKQSDSKPLFKILGNSRMKKSDASETKNKRSVLNFRKNDNAKIHEKYIPFPPPKPPTPPEHIYMEPRPWIPQSDECCRPPIYQSVEKLNRDEPRRMYGNYNRPPCYDELTQRLSQEKLRRQNSPDRVLANKITQNNNKVVIYFGDSIIRKHSNDRKRNEEIYQNDIAPQKDEVIYANQLLQETDNLGLDRNVVDKGGGTNLVSEVNVPEITYTAPAKEPDDKKSDRQINDATYKKDDFGTVNSEGFFVVKFEENFETAKQLVDMVQGACSDENDAAFPDEDGDPCDWSFIQDWRKRPSTCRPEEAWCGVTGARALRVASAAAPPAHARRLSPPPPAHRATTPPPPLGAGQGKPPRPHEDCPTSPPPPGGAQLKPVSAPSHITVQSTPVRSAPAQTSYGLDKRGDETTTANGEQVLVRECQSSSDENRSSGHASMSDSGGGGEARETPRDAPRRARQPPRAKHRPHNKNQQSPWSGNGGLEQIRSAIKQLSVRSRDSTSTATSTGTSTATSAASGPTAQECASQAGSGAGTGAGGAEARRRRAGLVRQASLDTVCTNVTNADEFVWLDSQNRLVELRAVPWRGSELSRVLQAARLRRAAPRLAPDAPHRLAYLLQRPLVRVAREASRLSQRFGFCSKHEVGGAFRIVLSTTLADACIKGCQRAATMFATSGAGRLAGAGRARTALSPGRFQRWMLDLHVAPFVHEYASIYLCAGMETLLEEMVLYVAEAAGGAGPGAGGAGGPAPGAGAPGGGAGGTVGVVTAAAADAALARSADWWGLLQPYSHLNAGRIATGELSLPRWESESSLGEQQRLSNDSRTTTNGSSGSNASEESAASASLLLSSCVGSVQELRSVLRKIQPNLPPFTPEAEQAMFYYMRCDQWENPPSGLWERGGVSGPPLCEWARVCRAAASLRPAPHSPRASDVLQAARLLLPARDCPPVLHYTEPHFSPKSHRSPEELSCALLHVAHDALLRGRDDLLPALRPLLPPAGLDAVDAEGLTVLMKAAINGDERVVAMLLEAGADPNVETPGVAAQAPTLLSPKPNAGSGPAPYTPPTAGWTALVYAVSGGAGGVARRLLGAGASPDGAAATDDRCTLTPLQLACGAGNLEMVQLLLSHGADPFLSTQLNDGLCYSAASQYGCYSAVSVCCSHGRAACLRAVCEWRPRHAALHVLSLEDVLAEGSRGTTATPTFTKAQQRALHDAMYCAAETDRLDITLELRSLGVPWSLHAWTLSLAAAAEAGLDNVIDQLLQDFLQVCPSDDSHYSKQFIYECLPLLFNILRYSKKEGTVLLLADILCACYGWEAVPGAPPAPAPPPARVDPAYVNSRALSDVTFRVEGRLFYGHKIVLVSESPRLRAMLAPRDDAPAPPLVQINDVRYHIFEIVMKYVYSGDWSSLEISDGDVLEVLAAAAYFQLPALQAHCEARAAAAVDLHNLVSVYIHAKVYNATRLLEYCQGFLLQNMVALLTYDDSVKRLLFGKRLPGHSVLGALLVTLQKRIESRKNQIKNNGPVR